MYEGFLCTPFYGKFISGPIVSIKQHLNNFLNQVLVANRLFDNMTVPVVYMSHSGYSLAETLQRCQSIDP